jgi:apolipoprotein N-acyltransferase
MVTSMKPNFLPAILAGILVGTSYIPLPPWAIFFCWTPLWHVWLREENLNKAALKNIFWSGWLTQFILTAIGFSWVSYTIHEFGHLPWVFALLCQAAYCSFANLYVPLAGVAWFLFAHRMGFSRTQKIIALPIFMNIGERIFPMIFDWHFGYTWLWAKLPAYHLADTFGFIGLSFFSLIFNAVIIWCYYRKSEGLEWAKTALAALAAFLALNGWGYFKSKHLEKPDASAKFLIVQANIGNQDKLLAETGGGYRDVVLDRFINKTKEGLAINPKPDFVVWPETAFPEIIEDPSLNYGYGSRLKTYIQQMNVKLITGGYARLPQTGQITNSFFVIDESGAQMAPPYHKTILLAFGEYFPFADYLPGLRESFPEVGNFGRGPGPTVLSAGELRIGAQICYEGLFDWFTRQLANQGAQILVNVTNDSWYGTWQQPWEHGWMTLARAVEVRRPLVRSTNTGISAVALASGEILPLSPLHQEWFSLYDVPYVRNPRPTAFMTWGYYFLPVMMFLTLFGLVWRSKARK